MPLKYLGVLVKHTRVTEAKCHILLDKIMTIFKAWPVKKLIYVGKAQFIDFGLMSIFTYSGQIFILSWS